LLWQPAGQNAKISRCTSGPGSPLR
jgi:hypothetical protein